MPIYQIEIEFPYTSARELDYSILKAIAENANVSTDFCFRHKGSSYLLPQEEKPTDADKTTWEKGSEYIPLAPYIPLVKPLDLMPDSKGEYYPQKGEIDLMKYYNYEYDKITNKRIPVEKMEERSVATEQDLILLLWLTKIKIL
jgi:hypothetical protein